MMLNIYPTLFLCDVYLFSKVRTDIYIFEPCLEELWVIFIVNEPLHMTTRGRINALNAAGGRKVQR